MDGCPSKAQRGMVTTAEGCVADYLGVSDAPPPVSPDSYLPLPDGSQVAITLEELQDLWEKMPEIYQEGVQRRELARCTYGQIERFGLQEITVPFSGTHPTGWVEQGGLGRWPVGVPVLTFRTPATSQSLRLPVPWLDDTKRGVPKDSVWRIVLSRVPNQVLMECAWDDLEGLDRLVNALKTTSTEAFAVQCLLTLSEEQRQDIEEDEQDILKSAQHLLTSARHLPEIKAEEYSRLVGKHVDVTQALVFDPRLLRYVRVPSLVCAMADDTMGLEDLDKALSKAGLTAIRGFSTQGWGDTQRLAVKRGFGKSFGKPLTSVWQVLGLPPMGVASTPTYVSLHWFREAVSKNLGVVDKMPLDWDAWLELDLTV